MSQGYHCARHLSKYFDEETLGGAGPYSALWGLYSFTGYYLATIGSTCGSTSLEGTGGRSGA